MKRYIEKILAILVGGVLFFLGLIFFVITIVAWFFSATMNTVYFFAPIAVVAIGVGVFLFFEGIFCEELSKFSRRIVGVAEKILSCTFSHC